MIRPCLQSRWWKPSPHDAPNLQSPRSPNQSMKRSPKRSSKRSTKPSPKRSSKRSPKPSPKPSPKSSRKPSPKQSLPCRTSIRERLAMFCQSFWILLQFNISHASLCRCSRSQVGIRHPLDSSTSPNTRTNPTDNIKYLQNHSNTISNIFLSSVSSSCCLEKALLFRELRSWGRFLCFARSPNSAATAFFQRQDSEDEDDEEVASVRSDEEH